MAFDRLVGEAYILLRGDGKLLKRDFERAAKNAGDESGDDFAKAFADSIAQDKVSERRVQKTLRDWTSALDAGDWSKFRARGEDANETAKRLNETILRTSNSLKLQSKDVNRLIQSVNDWRDSTINLEEARERAERKDRWIAENNRQRTEWAINESKARQKAIADENRLRQIAIDDQERAWRSYSRNLNSVEQDVERFRSSLDGMRTSLIRALSSGDWSHLRRNGESVNDMFSRMTTNLDRFVDRMHLSERSAVDMRRSLERWTFETDRLERETARLNRIDEERNRILKEQKEGYFDLDEGVRRVRRGLRGMSTDFIRGVDTGSFAHMAEQGERTRDTVRRLADTVQQFRDVGSLSEEDTRRLTNAIRVWGRENNTAGGRLSRLSNELDRGADKASRFSMILGTGFGRGGRNDFIHFIGTAVTGLSKLVTVFPLSLASRVSRLGSTFADAFSASRAAGLSRFASAGQGVAAMLTNPAGLIAGLVGAVAAIKLVTTVLPALASLISMLGASVTALTASVSFGLIGALLALGPVLVAGAGGFVAMAYGATKFFQESATGKKVLAELKAALGDVADAATEGFAQVAEVALPGVLSLIEDFADSVYTVSTDLANKLSDPVMKQFYEDWGIALPQIFESLGRGINSLGVALIAFFRPVLPYAQRLADGFEDMMNRFLNWSKSAEGQNKIAEFMDKAWIAAGKLKDILGELWEIIGTVFWSGNENAGDSFLDSILAKLEKFSDWLKSPEGQDAMKRWFEDAKRFASDLWAVLGMLGEAFDKLDSPEGRKSLSDIMNFVLTVGHHIGNVWNLILFLEGLADAWIRFTGFKMPRTDSFSAFISDMTSNMLRANPIVMAFSALSGPLTSAWEAATSWFGGPNGPASIPRLLIENVLPQVTSFVQQLTTGVISGLVSFGAMLVSGVQNAFSMLGSFLIGIGTAIVEWLTSPFQRAYDLIVGNSIVPDMVNEVIDWITGLPGKIGTALAGLVGVFTRPFTEAWTAITTKLGEIGSSISSKANEWKTSISTKLEEMKTSVAQKWDQMKTDASAKWESIKTTVTSKVESLRSTAAQKVDQLKTSLASKVDQIRTDMSSKWESIRATVTGKVESLRSNLSTRWDQIRTAASSKVDQLRTAVTQRFESVRANVSSKLNQMRSSVSSWGIAGAARSAVSGIQSIITSPFSAAASAIRSIISGISASISNLLGTASSIAGQVQSRLSSIRMPSIPRPPWMASGGIEYGPRIVGVGEAGPEAIVPLSRPLSMVDPSVRALSAFAQGKMGPDTVTNSTERTVRVEKGAINVMVPNANPELVAESVLDRIAAEIAG